MPEEADAVPEIVVVDASAIIGLAATGSVLGERIAARLGGDVVLHAPAHLPIEVDSGLRGLALGGKLTIAQATTARRSAARLPIELWPWELLADRAWELRENVSTYDAGYVALAERLGAALVTGDARIARAPGVRCRVEVFG